MFQNFNSSRDPNNNTTRLSDANLAKSHVQKNIVGSRSNKKSLIPLFRPSTWQNPQVGRIHSSKALPSQLNRNDSDSSDVCFLSTQVSNEPVISPALISSSNNVTEDTGQTSRVTKMIKRNSIVRRNFRSIHTTLSYDSKESSAEVNCKLPSAEGLNLLQSHSRIPIPVASELKNESNYNDNSHILDWENSNTLVIKLPPRPEASSSISETRSIQSQYKSQESLGCPLVTLSLEIAKVADRTRGYFMCPICNEPFCNPAIIGCGHLFCVQCVSNWFEGQDNCPCCRFPVIMKDISISDSVLAKESTEIRSLLVSTLTTGNFYTCAKDLLGPSSLASQDSDPLQERNAMWQCNDFPPCKYSENVLNTVAPMFQEFLQIRRPQRCHQQHFLTTGRKSSDVNLENIKAKNNFIGALWYLRHGMLLQSHFNSNLYEDDDALEDNPTVMRRFAEITKHEAYHGTESSCELLVTKVLSMKKPTFSRENIDLRKLSLPTTNSRQMSFLDSRTNTSNILNYRFRLPNATGWGKMCLSGFLFFIVVIAVLLFDDLRRGSYRKDPNKVRFCKMDLFVYSATIAALILYTETERINLWRRRAGTIPNRSQRRDRRRRREGRE